MPLGSTLAGGVMSLEKAVLFDRLKLTWSADEMLEPGE